MSAPAPPADDLEEFYARLVSIKEFHRKNPDVDSRAVESEIRTLVEGPDETNDDELAVDRESSPAELALLPFPLLPSRLVRLS